MKFSRSIPIFYSADINRSIAYYMDVLGFESKWTYDDPPTFGGVSKNSVDIFFCKEAQGHPGTWLCIMLDNVDEYHESIKAKGAKILYPPETYEWGLREMLVEDPDGHRIRFGSSAPHHGKQSEAPAPEFRLVDRKPTMQEYRQLVEAVGWSATSNAEMSKKVVEAAIHAVVAEDIATGNAISCALVIGDNASFYYVKDVIVHPDWQGKHVGTAVMQQLISWVDRNAPPKALVALFTGENLTRFYQQFGFRPSFGMSYRVPAKD